MGAVGRIIGIVLAVVLVAAAVAYFAVGSVARGQGSFTVERAPQTVVTWLASAPQGAPVAEGATIAEVVSHEGNTVVANVNFTDGGTGRVTYTVTPDAANPTQSRVDVRLERNLGLNPLNRVQAVTGGDAPLLAEAAAASASTALTALRADITPIVYSIETLAPQPFFFIRNCSPTDPESVTSVVRQALNAARSVMRDVNITVAGSPIAVEPRVENNQYCYEVGYPYSGAQPGVLAVGAVGQTPNGTVLRIDFTGAEADVVPQVYDRIDALLAAARLDDPGVSTDDWTTAEVYHDDPTQPGGSRNRTIYYVAPQGVDLTRLTALAPPAEAPPAAPAAAPGEQAPAATAPPAQTPAATP